MIDMTIVWKLNDWCDNCLKNEAVCHWIHIHMPEVSGIDTLEIITQPR